MRVGVNIILTLLDCLPSFCGKGFLSHKEPPKNAESRVVGTLLASLYFKCGSGNLLLAGCSSAEPVSSSAPQSAKLTLIFELRFLHWIFTDESVLVFYTVFYNGKSLSEEFVGDCDNSYLPGLSPGSESLISVAAFGVEASRRKGCHIQKPPHMAVAVTVDMSVAVDGRTGLLIRWGETEVSGKLFGIVKVRKSGGGDYECRCQRYAYSLNRCEKFELFAELAFSGARQILFQLGNLFFKEFDCVLDSFYGAMVYDGKHLQRMQHVPACRELLLELAQHRPHLLELHQRLSRNLVRLRLHALPIKSYQASIRFVSFGCGEHDSCEILNFKRVFHADYNPVLRQQIKSCHAIGASGLHNTVAIFVEGADELPDTFRSILELSHFAFLPRRVRHGECVFADVNSDISHVVDIYSEASIHRKLPLRNTGSSIRPNELSSLGCKSMVAEHFYGSFSTNETAALLHALMLYLRCNFNN